MRFVSSRVAVYVLLMLVSGAALAEPVLVTGYPASRAFLQRVLRARGWTEFPGSQLEPGQKWVATDGREVLNLDWRPPPAALAALSDHPEEVHERGSLFSGGLTLQRPIRLQYYHLSDLKGESPQLQLWLTNPQSKPARIHLSGASGVPSTDYFSTGHGNNVSWFGARMREEGEFVSLEPGESKAVYFQDFPFQSVVSGTLKLTLVEGAPVTFDFIANPDGKEAMSLNNLLKEGDVHSRGFYPVATHHLRRRYVVGGGQTLVAIGALRQETFSGVRELRGDYGVLYDLELEVINPSHKAAVVKLLFNPRGGVATATFWCQGKIIEVPMTQAKKNSPIMSLSLAPNSRQLIRLRTIPEGASSYPVRIVVGS